VSTRRLQLLVVGLAVIATMGVARAADIGSAPTLTLSGAKSLLAAAVRYAESHQAPGGAITIVDATGSVIVLERLDGTFSNASPVSIGKARTAALFAKPTRDFEDAVNQGRYTMLAVAEIAAFTPLRGGVPIQIDGHVVGAIGVSGAASAAQDDEIASAAVAAFLQSQAHKKKSP
jgi:uncharacterized protein GlcG (DUF336 family)